MLETSGYVSLASRGSRQCEIRASDAHILVLALIWQRRCRLKSLHDLMCLRRAEIDEIFDWDLSARQGRSPSPCKGMALC